MDGPLQGAQTERVWRTRLATQCAPNLLRVDICWAGRPPHPNDRGQSLMLEQLAPLLELEGICFVSLQKDVPAQDRTTLERSLRLIDLSKDIADFECTAAIVGNLDLVISIDSSVAHLAGALGIPTWILLAKPSDWRCFLDRSDSPWYPSVRPFHQTSASEWGTAIDAAKSQLATLRYGRLSVALQQQ